MYNEYLKQKEKYSNCVILMRAGSFYRTYDQDAIILFYLCHYQVIKNMLGFPIRSLNKVLKELKCEKVNFIVDDEMNICVDNEENYLPLYEKSLERYQLKEQINQIYSFLNDNIERKFIQKIIHQIEEVIDVG